MFSDHVYQMSSAEYTDRIILIDLDHVIDNIDYTNAFVDHGFTVIRYEDDLRFRVRYEEVWKSKDGKFAVIADGEKFIPYDVQACAKVFRFSKNDLFPRLNPAVLTFT